MSIKEIDLDHWETDKHDEDLKEGRGTKMFQELGAVLAKCLVTERQIDRLSESLRAVTSSQLATVTTRSVEETPEPPTLHVGAVGVVIDEEQTEVGMLDTGTASVPGIAESPVIAGQKIAGIDATMLALKKRSEADEISLQLAEKEHHLASLNVAMAHICANLEKMHRGSVPTLEAVFNDIGSTVLPLLVRVLNRSQDENPSFVEVEAIGNVVKVLCYFSQGGATRFAIANQKGLLRLLIGVAQAAATDFDQIDSEGKVSCDDDDHEVDKTVTNDVRESFSAEIVNDFRTDEPKVKYPEDIRLHIVGTVANLTCDEDSIEKLLAQEGFVPAIVDIAKNDPNEQARQLAVVIFANVSVKPGNTTPLVACPELLEVLVAAASSTSSATKMYAISSLGSLCNFEANNSILANYDEGAVIRVLTHVISDSKSTSNDARSGAAGALLKLTRNSPVSWWDKHGLTLDLLATAVLSDTHISVRVKAAETLKELSRRLSTNSDLINALVKATRTRDPSSKCCIAEALQIMSTNVGSRKMVAEHPGVLNALVGMAMLDDEDENAIHTRNAAIGAINGLASKAANRPLMAKNQELIFALVKAVGRDSEKRPDSRASVGSASASQMPQWTYTKKMLLAIVEKM